MDKANQSGGDVLAFELWHQLFVKTAAVAALKITEFNNSEWCAGVT